MSSDTTYTQHPEIQIFPDKEALAQAAAQRFVAFAKVRTEAGEPFRVALAGGSTPKALYALLAAAPYRDEIDWSLVHLFFGDERCVPSDSEDSNYNMVKASLLGPSPQIPSQNVHRMPADLPDHEQAALQYEDELRTAFASSNDSLDATGAPRFDLILLGMGPDGHTASLFPHKPALHVQDRLVVATEPGLKPFVPRLTLTFPVLNAAAQVLFLVAGEDKAVTLARVLNGSSDSEALPSQSVRPTHGHLTWLVDKDAASELS